MVVVTEAQAPAEMLCSAIVLVLWIYFTSSFSALEASVFALALNREVLCLVVLGVAISVSNVFTIPNFGFTSFDHCPSSLVPARSTSNLLWFALVVIILFTVGSYVS